MALNGGRAFNGHIEFEVEDFEEERTKAMPDLAKTATMEAEWHQRISERLSGGSRCGWEAILGRFKENRGDLDIT